MRARVARLGFVVPALLAFCTVAAAADIGQLKSAAGEAWIERTGNRVDAAVGTRVQAGDVLRTGANGTLGLVMLDNSLLSLGPNSVLTLDRLDYDATTHQGRFDTSLQKGSLGVISGRIAKQSPNAMAVRTPSAILGVRGTEFVVAADD